MLAILVALVSIGVITSVMWFLNRRELLPVKICAICAGTAGTWLLILAGIFTNTLSFAAYMPVAAILMGGSVVGIAYQGEKRLKAGRDPLLWKALFIPIGFGTVWSVTHFAFGFVILGVLVLAVLAGFFLKLPAMPGRRSASVGNRDENLKRLEKEMEHCC